MEQEQTPMAEGTQGTPAAVETPQALEERPASVEGAGSAPEAQSGHGKEFNVQNYINANKRVTDGLKKDISEIKELLKAVQSQPAPAQAPSAPSPEADIFTNPQEYVRNEVRNALKTDLQSEFGKQRLKDQQEKAEAYILSQDYIDPESEADRAELQKIHEERGFNLAWNVSPFAAAEGILEIFKARKGIGKPTPPKSQAGAVLSGASPSSNGKKVWTSAEVTALPMKDYENIRSEIDAAIKEGRYRE